MKREELEFVGSGTKQEEKPAQPEKQNGELMGPVGICYGFEVNEGREERVRSKVEVQVHLLQRDSIQEFQNSREENRKERMVARVTFRTRRIKQMMWKSLRMMCLIPGISPANYNTATPLAFP